MKNRFLFIVGLFTLSMTLGSTNSWAVELPEQTKKSPVFSQSGGMERPENVIVVAKSGGDFTTITDALASLPVPNTTPTVIEVKPGTYAEINPIQMKDFVHLRGSGTDVTTIQETTSDDMFILNGLTNVEVSDFTFISTYEVFWNTSSSPKIKNNTFILDGYVWGIYND